MSGKLETPWRECVPRSATDATPAPSSWRRHPNQRFCDTLGQGGGAQMTGNLIEGMCHHVQVSPERSRREAGSAIASCVSPPEPPLPQDTCATDPTGPEALDRLANKRLVKQEPPAQVTLQLLITCWPVQATIIVSEGGALKVGWALPTTSDTLKLPARAGDPHQSWLYRALRQRRFNIPASGWPHASGGSRRRLAPRCTYLRARFGDGGDLNASKLPPPSSQVYTGQDPCPKGRFKGV